MLLLLVVRLPGLIFAAAKLISPPKPGIDVARVPSIVAIAVLEASRSPVIRLLVASRSIKPPVPEVAVAGPIEVPSSTSETASALETEIASPIVTSVPCKIIAPPVPEVALANSPTPSVAVA